MLAIIHKPEFFFSIFRRPALPTVMMALMCDNFNLGKPLAGIRTASHEFGAKPADAQHEGWENFDIEVLGCHYEGHYGNTATTRVRICPGGASHPVLTCVPTNEVTVTSSLYWSRHAGKGVTPLMTGQVEGQSG